MLTKEDIESFGFNLNNDNNFPYRGNPWTDKYIKDKYTLLYCSESLVLEILKDISFNHEEQKILQSFCYFIGKVQNKSELKILLNCIINPIKMNTKPQLIKANNKNNEDPRPKRNYQKKQLFVSGIGYDEYGRIVIEVRKKGNRIIEVKNPFIYDISASSFESAISKVKKVARKRYISNSTIGQSSIIWNSQNVPIITKGLDQMKEHLNWQLVIKEKAPLSNNRVRIRKYKKELRKKLK